MRGVTGGVETRTRGDDDGDRQTGARGRGAAPGDRRACAADRSGQRHGRGVRRAEPHPRHPRQRTLPSVDGSRSGAARSRRLSSGRPLGPGCGKARAVRVGQRRMCRRRGQLTAPPLRDRLARLPRHRAGQVAQRPQCQGTAGAAARSGHGRRLADAADLGGRSQGGARLGARRRALRRDDRPRGGGDRRGSVAAGSRRSSWRATRG